METFVVLTPPAVEPVSLTDIKLYTRVDFTADDAVLNALITRARRKAEAVTNRALGTQTIQATYTLERPVSGPLSGPVDMPVNWYQYSQQLGANPFGAVPFYFDLPAPPLQSVQLVEWQYTMFDAWNTIDPTPPRPGAYPRYIVDNTLEPGRVYFYEAPFSLRYRFTYTAGYDPAARPMPEALTQTIAAMVAYWYDNREAALPQELIDELLAFRSYSL